MFRELHRRHPDVDIVILAEDEPHAGPQVPLEEAQRSSWVTQRAFEEVLVLLGLGAIPDAAARWRAGAADGTVRHERSASADMDEALAPESLGGLADALLARMWQVQEPSEGVPRVLASHEDVSVQASWWDGVLRLLVLGPHQSVGRDGVRALCTESSWATSSSRSRSRSSVGGLAGRVSPADLGQCAPRRCRDRGLRGCGLVGRRGLTVYWTATTGDLAARAEDVSGNLTTAWHTYQRTDHAGEQSL